MTIREHFVPRGVIHTFADQQKVLRALSSKPNVLHQIELLFTHIPLITIRRWGQEEGTKPLSNIIKTLENNQGTVALSERGEVIMKLEVAEVAVYSPDKE